MKTPRGVRHTHQQPAGPATHFLGRMVNSIAIPLCGRPLVPVLYAEDYDRTTCAACWRLLSFAGIDLPTREQLSVRRQKKEENACSPEDGGILPRSMTD